MDAARNALKKYRTIHESNWARYELFLHYFLFFLNENGFMQNTDDAGEMDRNVAGNIE